MVVETTDIVSDQGSIVVFGGVIKGTERYVTFGVDRRMAQGLADLLGGGMVLAEVEGWQILGGQ